jgi:predicted transcriptional regulator
MPKDIIAELRRTSVLDEVLLDGDELRRRLNEEDREETDRLLELVRYRPVLEAIFQNPLDRQDLERELGVSRASSHRFTKRLTELGLVERVDGKFRLTGYGEVVVDETFRFETNVRAGRRLAPLLETICEYHREFVIAPFADAVVTTASPEDPYAPVDRFVSLAAESETFRGFNTTQIVPFSVAGFHERLFAGTDAEVIYLPDAVERLLETYPERVADAVARGDLALRSRDALPYGLAIFDDRVGVGGYDPDTGTLRVFVDTDATIARDWAESVYELYRSDSEALADRPDVPDPASAGSTPLATTRRGD